MIEKIIELTKENLGFDDKDITADTSFKEDLEADSLDLFQVIMELEDAFDVKVEEVENIKTVSDAVNYIEKATAAK